MSLNDSKFWNVIKSTRDYEQGIHILSVLQVDRRWKKRTD